jgi:TonB family C-terminal domain
MAVLQKLLALTSAIAISFVLFISIPLMRNILGYHRPESKLPKENRQIIAEMVRTIPKKEQPEMQAIRQVNTASSATSGLSSGREGLAFKFAPDLSVEGSGGVAVAMQNQDLEAMVFEEGQVDENVVPLFTPSIAYPERAKEIGVQGTLEAIIIIGRDGKVEKVDILRSPHESITQEAKRVLFSWRFKPGKNKGIPVKVRAKQLIDFNLDQ